MKMVFVISFFAMVLFTGCVADQDDSSLSSSQVLPMNQEDAQVNSTPVLQHQPTEFTARFEIATNGTKRIFTDKKYHNQSPEVYIESSDPSRITVKKAGITWSNFFQTLPMSLSSSCLVTGTKQTFCSNETHTLRFWINGVETPDALDAEMKPEDFLKVEYGR